MSRADLFVMSSRWEGLPTVLIEALACGATIVFDRLPRVRVKYWTMAVLALCLHRKMPMRSRAQSLSFSARLCDPHRERAEDFSDTASVSRYLELLER